MICNDEDVPCVIDINLSKFTFTVVFNYLGIDEVYIFYIRTQKIVLGLKGLSSFNITAGNSCTVIMFQINVSPFFFFCTFLFLMLL